MSKARACESAHGVEVRWAFHNTSAVTPTPFRLAIVFPWIFAEADDPEYGCRDRLTPEECSSFLSASTLPANILHLLATAAKNAALVDWLIVHDASSARLFSNVTQLLPPNVRLVREANLTALYQQRLGFDRPFSANKVKDFKPMIGHVFAHLLRGYSHWAMGDADVVYGALPRFLTAEVLSRYDIISLVTTSVCRPRQRTLLAGQLSVFRNVPALNSLFMQAAEWRGLPLRPYSFFDERAFPAAALRLLGRGRLLYLASQYTDMPRQLPAWGPPFALVSTPRGRLLQLRRSRRSADVHATSNASAGGGGGGGPHSALIRSLRSVPRAGTERRLP
mmetsp:Transcript_11501/g.23399  ORF Transcript_11501/g.23399 Transcript_11501/m.23399 type:complete len:335 (-) Transcript_11501:377-1381(-)